MVTMTGHSHTQRAGETERGRKREMERIRERESQTNKLFTS